MKKNARKYLSFILTLAMILGCCNGFVMAVYADDEPGVEASVEETEPVVELEQGAIPEEPGEEPVEELDNLQEEFSEEPFSLGAPLMAPSALGAPGPEGPVYEAESVEIVLTTYAAVAEEGVEVETAIASLTLSDGTQLKDSRGLGYSVKWDYTIEGLTAAGFGVNYVTISNVTKTESVGLGRWAKTSTMNYADVSVPWYICSEETTLTKGTDTASEAVSEDAKILFGDAVAIDENSSTIIALNKGCAVVRVGEDYVLYNVVLRQLSDAEITLGKNVYLYNGESHSIWPDVAITTTHWAFSILRGGYYVEEETEYLSADEGPEYPGDFEIVSGGEAVYPGKYTLVLRGVNDFEGELTADWYICSSAEALGAANESREYSKASVVMSSGDLSIYEAEGNVNVSAD